MVRTDPEFHVGIDGGGTGCRVAIAGSTGSIVAEATGGPANVTTDFEQAMANVLATLEAAAQKAGLTRAQVAATPAHAGLAGVMDSSDATAVQDRLPFSVCRVSDDRLTSTIGALGQRGGVLLAVGTGSFVAIKRGQDVRYLGGWGLQIGDQASGGWLGRSLLMRCVLVSDGLETASGLTDAVLSRFQNDARNITAFAGTAQPSDYAAFAPEIVKAATTGDRHGLELMREGASYLTKCIAAADLSASDSLCVTGGLGTHYLPFLDPDHQARLVAAAGTALDGALFLAARTGVEESAG